MKKIILFFFSVHCCVAVLSQTGSIGIGTTNPNSSAALDIQSTTRGVLIPRLTTAQRNAIPSPATGLMVYDNTTNSFWYKGALNWVEISDTANNVWKKNNDNVYTDAVNVGVGTSNPLYNLDINGSSRVGQDLVVNRDEYVFRNLEVNGHAVLRDGTTVQGTFQANQNAYVLNNLSVTGNITADGGKGIVRGNNTQQLVVIFPIGTVGFTNAPPGFTSDVLFSLSDVFAGTPLISVAQVLNASGNFEHWTVTVHTVDIANNRFTVRFHNASGFNSTFSATYRFIAIGAAL